MIGPRRSHPIRRSRQWVIYPYLAAADLAAASAGLPAEGGAGEAEGEWTR